MKNVTRLSKILAFPAVILLTAVLAVAIGWGQTIKKPDGTDYPRGEVISYNPMESAPGGTFVYQVKTEDGNLYIIRNGNRVTAVLAPKSEGK